MNPLIGIALCLALPLLPGAGRAALQNDRPAVSTDTPAHVQSVLQSLERQRSNAILQRDISTLRKLMDHTRDAAILRAMMDQAEVTASASEGAPHDQSAIAGALRGTREAFEAKLLELE